LAQSCNLFRPRCDWMAMNERRNANPGLACASSQSLGTVNVLPLDHAHPQLSIANALADFLCHGPPQFLSSYEPLVSQREPDLYVAELRAAACTRPNPVQCVHFELQSRPGSVLWRHALARRHRFITIRSRLADPIDVFTTGPLFAALLHAPATPVCRSRETQLAAACPARPAPPHEFSIGGSLSATIATRAPSDAGEGSHTDSMRPSRGPVCALADIGGEFHPPRTSGGRRVARSSSRICGAMALPYCLHRLVCALRSFSSRRPRPDSQRSPNRRDRVRRYR